MKAILILSILFSFQISAQLPEVLIGTWSGIATYDQSGDIFHYPYSLKIDEGSFEANIGGGEESIYRSEITFDRNDPKKFSNKQYAWNGNFFGNGTGYCLLNRCSITAVRKKDGHAKFIYTDNYTVLDHNTIILWGHHINDKGVIFDSWYVRLARVSIKREYDIEAE